MLAFRFGDAKYCVCASKPVYLNLIALTGVILLTSIDGMIITNRQTSNVPTFNKTRSVK